MLKGKTILIGVTGGIACYKVCDLVRELKKKEADVHVIMTASAMEFISPLTFKALSGNEVHTEMFTGKYAVPHIELAGKVDLVVVAPATANIISKIAHGIADDLLSTLLLACKAPIILAPAMNTNMYYNPVVQENLTKIESLGINLIEPGSGKLACGTSGKGRMAEPEEILFHIEELFNEHKKDLIGKKVLVTAGGTREPIDPVRYIGNRSSGKMGYALANAASKRGAEVTLITSTIRDFEPGVNIVKVETALQMYQEVISQSHQNDLIIMAAAVADYKPRRFCHEKIKKNYNDTLVLELERNPDILKELGRKKRAGQIIIGFAAETNELKENAIKKLKSKNADIIVANDVTNEEAGFGSDKNLVTIFDKNGKQKDLPLLDKFTLANEIISYALYSLN